jgi:hypothetical protein
MRYVGTLSRCMAEEDVEVTDKDSTLLPKAWLCWDQNTGPRKLQGKGVGCGGIHLNRSVDCFMLASPGPAKPDWQA